MRPFLLLACLPLVGCHAHPEVLARVAGRSIKAEDIANVVRVQTGRNAADVAPDLIAALFESYLEEEVILAASPNPGDRDLPFAERGARTRELLSSLCPPPLPPSSADIEARVASEREKAGERVLLRQLILPDATSALAARDRLRTGEDFAKLSSTLSRAPNAKAGGMIGWIERGQLPPEFEAAVMGLAQGEVSQPVQSNAGWHVFQVIARRHPGEGDDEAVRSRIRDELEAAAAETTRRACLHDLAARVGVEVPCAGASFPCANPFEVQP